MKDTPHRIPNHAFRLWLERNRACDKAREWCRTLSMKKSWLSCHDPRWMMWALQTSGYADQHDLVMRRIACRMVRLTESGEHHLFDVLDDYQSDVVRACEKYCDDKISFQELLTLLESALRGNDAEFCNAMLTDVHYRRMVIFSLTYVPTNTSSLCVNALSWSLYLSGKAPLSSSERRQIQMKHADLIRRIISWTDIHDHMQDVLLLENLLPNQTALQPDCSPT